MDNKKNKRKKYNTSDVLLFADGGNITGAIGGAANMISGAVNNLKVPEVKPLNVEANNMDSLMSEWANYKKADLGRTDVAGAALSGLSSGAALGSVIPGVGTAIGAGIGLIGGGVTSLIGNANKQKKENELNSQMMNSFSNKANSLNAQSMDNTLANMMADGGFTNNVTSFNEGGTHEQNPNSGVPQGIGQNGKPNLVEEGEVKFKDYIYSNRLSPSESILSEVGLHTKYKGKTFGEIANMIQKESEERPNDPISKNGLNNSMERLQKAQEIIKLKKEQRKQNAAQMEMLKQGIDPTMMQSPMQMAEGGNLPQGIEPNMEQLMQQVVAWMQEGMSPEQIIRQLVTAGVPAQQAQELVMQTQQQLSQEQPQQQIPQEFALGGNLFSGVDGTSFMDLNNRAMASANTFDAVSLKPGQIPGVTLMNELSPTGAKGASFIKSQNAKGNIIAGQSAYNDLTLPKATTPPAKSLNFGAESLRYAPVLGAGLMSLSDAFGLTNKPNYDTADALAGLSVKGERVNNYMAYNPMDRDYYQNKLNANAGATRAGLANASGGNRANYMAGLLGADYNYGENMGNIARQAEEYNLGQRQKVEEFNRGTNQFNAQQSNWEQGINTDLKMKAITARADAKNISNSAKTANLGNLLDNLGNVGREEMAFNMIKSDPSKYYEIGRDGKIKYKGNQKKNGGKLKKKGIDYGII